MAWTHGINSGRVCNRSSDAYGRWSSLTMLHKDEQKTMFISAYKVCKGTKLDGTGIASQQYRAMVRDGMREKNQRQQFDDDLKQFVGHHYQQGKESMPSNGFQHVVDVRRNEHLPGRYGNAERL